VNKRAYLLLAGAAGDLLWIWTCCSGFSRPSDVTAEQIHIINTQLNALQEMMASISSSRGWALLLFAGSVLVPIVLGVLLLYRADQTRIHSDEVLNQAARDGLTGDMVRAALVEQGKVKDRSRRLVSVFRVRRLFLLAR
jgi:hypothetical protein